MALKSYTKRFKLTKTGKVLRRTQGISHALAGKSGNTIRNKRTIGQSAKVDKAKFTNK